MDNYADYTFDAFISYSHRDLSWGNWLQRKLETFRIPKGLTPDRPGDKKLRVFRDQTDLTGTELQDSLRQNLRESRYLIVICSPASAASSWVNEEVLYFASLGRRDKIIPFIVDGEPNSDEPEMECFPQGLREIEDFTPLGANVREIGKDKAYLKLVSILLDVRFGRLVDREKQRRIRTAIVTGLTVAVIALVGGTLLWRNIKISRENHQLNYDIYGAALVSIAKKDVIEPEDVAFLKASAEEGNTQAIILLADCYKNGWGTEQDLDQLFYWSKVGAELGDPTCMISLANCYHNGEGTEKNPEEAYAWDLKAAEAGDASGMLNVGIFYEEGLGVGQDSEKALYWYQKSAEAGNDLGMYNLARCYLMGIGTEKNPELAFAWTQKLAETGNAEGMYNLGLMYQYGYGTSEDPESAYEWYLKAANAGDADGAYMTGWCLENNYGAPDPAVQWYRTAAELGSEQAEEALERLD